MRLTSFTDYALRVLIFLAAGREPRATVGEIAAAFDISESHLTKVAHFLGRQGWVVTVRGKGGGLQLARPPGTIGVGEVVRRAEGEGAFAECFEARPREGLAPAEGPGAGRAPCSIADMCGLQAVLREAVAAFFGVLDRYTVQDLVQDPQRLRAVLFVPRATAPQAPLAGDDASAPTLAKEWPDALGR
ncbi:RrF2 family transcriptional regulator [Schlegelella aquatica]|uniref:RrF2 family transcriptional regulator n=1 Tax=Caldimonas aquatica TaxID=376175 RepID=UPI0037532761